MHSLPASAPGAPAVEGTQVVETTYTQLGEPGAGLPSVATVQPKLYLVPGSTVWYSPRYYI